VKSLLESSNRVTSSFVISEENKGEARETPVKKKQKGGEKTNNGSKSGVSNK
jgi:hypothetical protein